MAEKYYWSIMLTKKLIIEYEKHEFLYNWRHPDYRNRKKRKKTYRDIVNTLNFIQKGLTIKDLKRKINGLRGQYLNEKIKVGRSRQSGADRDCVYRPKAYWFPLMKFLDNVTSISNLDEIEEKSSYSGLGEAANLEIDSGNEQAEKIQETKRNNSALNGPTNSINHQPQNKQRKRSQQNDFDSSLTKMSEFMSKIPKLAPVPVDAGDECDVFGKFVAQEIREIRVASDQIVYRQVKRQIQLCLMNTWDSIESTPRATTDLLFTSDSTDAVENSSIIFNDIIKTE